MGEEIIIFVKVKANAKENRVEKIGEKEYVVYAKEKRERGKANMAVIKLLSKEFGTTTQKISILKGTTSTKKIIKIEKG